MKPDCNINMKELTNIVDGMLAEKNELGRQAFKHMIDEMTPGAAGQAAEGGLTPADQGEAAEQSSIENLPSGEILKLAIKMIEESGINHDVMPELRRLLVILQNRESGTINEWSNLKDFEGAYETLRDEMIDLIGQYQDIVKDGPNSPYQDESDVVSRKVYNEVAGDLADIVNGVDNKYGT